MCSTPARLLFAVTSCHELVPILPSPNARKKKECACEPGGELTMKAAMEAKLFGEARMAISPSPKFVRPYGCVKEVERKMA